MNERIYDPSNHEVTARHFIDLNQKLLRHFVTGRMTEEEIGS